MKIIAGDGCDGSGKSTQTILLRDYLNIDLGKKVEHYQMPGATEIGQELRKLVKSRKFPTAVLTERLMFAADTVQFFAEKVDTERERPDFAVIDRFSPFTDLIYGVASGLNEDWLLNLQETCKIVCPCDLLIIFKCSYETILERKGAMEKGNMVADRIEARGEVFMRHVVNGYNELARLVETLPYAELPEKWRKRAKKIAVVDANNDRVLVRDQIREIVTNEFFPA